MKKATKEMAKGLIQSYVSNVKVKPNTYEKLPLDLGNWYSGKGWCASRIKMADEVIEVNDAMITDKEFINWIETAIKVHYDIDYTFQKRDYWSGTPEQYQFKSVRVFGAPCKEYNTLIAYIERKIGRKLREVQANPIWKNRVCGKRSSWSESGKRIYLMYDPKSCAFILDILKKGCKRGGKLSVQLKGFFSHGDECDYKCAQYQESEWYGGIAEGMVLTMTNAKVKLRAY